MTVLPRDRRERLLDLLEREGPLRAYQIEARTGWRRGEIVTALQRLADQGEVAATPTGWRRA